MYVCVNIFSQHIPNLIVNIQAMGHRIFVSDVQESLYMVRYKRQENQLIIFADDTNARWITTATVLDFDTVATADKFGNIAIVRCHFVSSVALHFEKGYPQPVA
jgi:splicing factor 3B subunit 3